MKFKVLFGVIFTAIVAFAAATRVIETNKLYIKDGTTANRVGIEVPSLAGSTVYKLPATDGTSGQKLSTDGSGNMSWQTIATNYANQSLSNLTSPTAINQDLIPSGTKALGNSTNKWNAGHFLSSILYGSTSGNITLQAADTTTSYSLKFPPAQGAATQTLVNDGAGNLSWGAGGGGGGNPGGLDTQMQYNNGGSLGGTTNFIWDDVNNRIGIGEATPLFPVHIKTVVGSGVSASALTIDENSATNNNTRVHLRGVTPVYQTTGLGAAGTLASPTTTVDGAPLGYFQAGGYDSAALNSNRGRMIVAGAGTWTPTSTPTKLLFETTNSGTAAATTKLTLNQDGSLIGTNMASFATPNASTTGGVQVRQPVGDATSAHIQFTNNAASAQRGVISASLVGSVGMYNGTGNGFFETGSDSIGRFYNLSAASSFHLSSAAATAGSSIEMNGGTGDRSAFIDFHSDDTFADYGFRIFKDAGTLGTTQFIQRGFGDINFTYSDDTNTTTNFFNTAGNYNKIRITGQSGNASSELGVLNNLPYGSLSGGTAVSQGTTPVLSITPYEITSAVPNNIFLSNTVFVVNNGYPKHAGIGWGDSGAQTSQLKFLDIHDSNSSGAFNPYGHTTTLEISLSNTSLSGTVVSPKYRFDSGGFKPMSDNVLDLGELALRWQDVFATNGVIQTSDRKKKKDINPIEDAIGFIKNLNPVSYRWKDDDKKTHFGFIAQDVEASFKGSDFGDIVTKDDKDNYGLSYQEIIAPLVATSQELLKRNEELERKVEYLMKRDQTRSECRGN